jgi:hypothetical protein
MVFCLNSKPKALLKVGPIEPGTVGEENFTQPQVWRLSQGDTLPNSKGNNSHQKKTTNFHDEI